MPSSFLPEASGRDALLAVLDFLVASGVDVALDEAPHDRFAEGDAPEPVRTAPSRRVGFSSPAAPDPSVLAASAHTLDELEAIVAAFDGCGLKASARQIAFADGAPGSRVMVLGEAPGSDEDRAGRPFVGRAGQLLDRMLAAIDLDRTAVYIANVVPWRPPGNRTPTPGEVAICLPFTLRQIELAAPEILVTVGAAATQAVLGTSEGILRMRGRWAERSVGTCRLRVLPMLHPAYLLRQPLHKRIAWRDLRLLRRALDEAPEPAHANPT